MNTETIMSFMDVYGSFIIFAFIFVEYLCIPGFPGGVCIPVSGTIARIGNLDFFYAYSGGVFSAILSQLFLYGVCTVFRSFVLKLCKKYSFMERAYSRSKSYIEQYGKSGLLIARMIPFVRTFVSFPAGLVKMRFSHYFLCSFVGTGVYILVMMSLGYFATELFI